MYSSVIIPTQQISKVCELLLWIVDSASAVCDVGIRKIRFPGKQLGRWESGSFGRWGRRICFKYRLNHFDHLLVEDEADIEEKGEDDDDDDDDDDQE